MGCFVTFLDQVNNYVIFHKFCYNYNIAGRLAMIFLNEFNFNQSFDEVSSGENLYDE